MQNGIIVKFKDESKYWIVLYVAKKDLKKIAVKQEGFYCFARMWHGRNPLKIKSYGKIKWLEGNFEIIRPSIHRLSVNQIKEMVG